MDYRHVYARGDDGRCTARVGVTALCGHTAGMELHVTAHPFAAVTLLRLDGSTRVAEWCGYVYGPEGVCGRARDVEVHRPPASGELVGPAGGYRVREVIEDRPVRNWEPTVCRYCGGTYDARVIRAHVAEEHDNRLPEPISVDQLREIVAFGESEQADGKDRLFARLARTELWQRGHRV